MHKKLEWNILKDDAIKRLENRNSENTYMFEGMNLEVTLKEGQMFASYGTKNLIRLLSEIESEDKDFTNRYKKLPKDMLTKLKSGEISDQGS